ncbi:hypothetical protein AVEN_269026-1 [Araneus ventricosus]|uniref:CCHC-type domain-containing protein n=1 Tax=Araneus ventricosus TaxID=182803 RepID=A0A4Y2QBU1_ARAVE|nr:hypothetical protein AVEN_269026-1 [Araneus ventricosus]
MGKDGEKSSQERERGDEEDSDEEPVLGKSDIINELKKYMDSLDSNDLLIEDIEVDLRATLKAFNKLSNATIQGKHQYGKKLRNKFALTFVTDMVNIVIKLCDKVKTRDATIYDLQGMITDCDMSLAKAKIWTLEKEKAALQGKLDAQAEISSTVQEIIPKLDDIKNSKDQNLIAEIPRIIKEVTSPDIRSSVEVAGREIMAEVKKTRDETRTFAHVAFQSRNLPPSQVPSSLRSYPLGEPEGILLIKPKKETLKDFIINKKIFTDILEKYDPSIRLRGIGKLYGGGVRMVAASHGDIMIVKGLIEEYGDKETVDGFDFVIPNRRSPQLIIYNVDGEVDQEQLKAGLLAKNITLADSANKPYFKVEFSIPARNSLKKHWVLSIDPKKFIEIKNKEGLYFQFSRLRTSEFISIRFCKRCFAYGHTTKNCDPKNEQKCDRCEGNNHKCSGLRCINCSESNSKFRKNFNTNHGYLDPDCKTYLMHK